MAIVNRHPVLQNRITLDDINDLGRKTPLLVDLKPSGENYMTDFHNAGGMLALPHTLQPLLHLSALTISGQTLGEVLNATPFKLFPYSTNIIRPLSKPIAKDSSLVILRGNLAPDGAVLKASASKDRKLLQHSGPAVVFHNTVDLAQRIDDSDLKVTANSVLVLQNIGPVGNPGMPEAGLIPIPRKLAAQGIVDMLRISDGRMSGTAGGTIVLHVSPEAAKIESVLGVIKNGDSMTCDVELRRLTLDVDEHEIQLRLKRREKQILVDESNVINTREKRRGYRGMYERCVNQAAKGADFDFLTASGHV